MKSLWATGRNRSCPCVPFRKPFPVNPPDPTVIWRSLEAARLAKDKLGAFLVMGLMASFTFQVIYNVTMSAGLAPVKGLTLPLMSYGGSSMMATLASFGLILNVRMRRFTN